jgi:hypothetical protein
VGMASNTNGEVRTRIGYFWEGQNEKSSLKRPRRRWVDNIRMDLGEMGWGNVDWICPIQDRDR